MKKLLIILICCVSVACTEKQKPKGIWWHPTFEQKITKPEFHIKVSFWGGSECWWKVSFTNDNFQTEEDIQDTFDISSTIMGNSVCRQLDLFESETKAVIFARKLTTYYKCRIYNDSVNSKYLRMVEYRKLHPVLKVEYNSESSCKNEKGKSTIIY
jgi:hypothetical protein